MKNIKRVVAAICAAVLLLIYVITFILAVTGSAHTQAMFKGCFACTIFVPLVAYIFMRLHSYAMWRSGRKDPYSGDEQTPGENMSSGNGQQIQR